MSTFGQTNIGTSTIPLQNVNVMCGSDFTNNSGSGTIVSMSFYTAYTAGTVQMGLYNSGGILIDNTGTFQPSGANWYTSNFTTGTALVTNGSSYILAWNHNSGFMNIYNMVSGGLGLRSQAGTFGQWSSFTGTASGTALYSLYVTFNFSDGTVASLNSRSLLGVGT